MNHLKFKISCVLFALLFAAIVVPRAVAPSLANSPQATAPSERDRLLDKVREVNRWGRDHRIVGDVARELDVAISQGQDAEIYIGWGLTSDKQAYRLYWKKSTFTFEPLTPQAAAALGFVEMDMQVKKLGPAKPVSSSAPLPPPVTKDEVFASGLPFFLISASVGDATGFVRAGQPVPVRLRIARGPAAAGGNAIQLSFTRGNSSTRKFSYQDLPTAPGEKEISFTYPWDEAFAGAGEIHAVITVISTPSATGGHVNLSNPVNVSFRIVP